MAYSLGKPLKLSFEKLIGKSPYVGEITHTHNLIFTISIRLHRCREGMFALGSKAALGELTGDGRRGTPLQNATDSSQAQGNCWEAKPKDSSRPTAMARMDGVSHSSDQTGKQSVPLDSPIGSRQSC